MRYFIPNRFGVFVVKTFVCFLVLLFVFAPLLRAQDGEPLLPEFPEQLAIVLGVLSSVITGFFKKRLPQNDLIRLLVAAGLSLATAVVAAFAVDIFPAGASGWALFLGAVYAYSQVSWTFYKAIRENGKA